MSLPTVRTPGSHLDRAHVLQQEGPTPSQRLASSLFASDLNTWAHPVRANLLLQEKPAPLRRNTCQKTLLFLPSTSHLVPIWTQHIFCCLTGQHHICDWKGCCQEYLGHIVQSTSYMMGEGSFWIFMFPPPFRLAGCLWSDHSLMGQHHTLLGSYFYSYLHSEYLGPTQNTPSDVEA